MAPLLSRPICKPTSGVEPPSDPGPASDATARGGAMRQIAYVGEDGELSVYDLETDQVISVSRVAEGLGEQSGPDRLTNWPMWSPNGELLAYFRFDLAS